MTDLDIQELANLTAGDADVDNFERLFTKLKEMKGNWGNEKQTQNFCQRKAAGLCWPFLKLTGFLVCLFLALIVGVEVKC